VYIQAHKSEFLPEGVDAAVIEAVPEAAAPAPGETGPGSAGGDEKNAATDEQKRRERDRNAKGLQWAYDTFDGARQVARRSTKGALELVRDAWDQSSTVTILWFVIVMLSMSNIWTVIRYGYGYGYGYAEADLKLESLRSEEREKWVQSVVSALHEEIAAAKQGQPAPFPGQVTPTSPPVLKEQSPAEAEVLIAVPSVSFTEDSKVFRPEDWREEIQNLLKTLDTVEERVKSLRERLVANTNALD